MSTLVETPEQDSTYSADITTGVAGLDDQSLADHGARGETGDSYRHLVSSRLENKGEGGERKVLTYVNL